MDKKVLITGITGSIGKALAKEFCSNGYFVYGIGKTQSKVNNIKKELPLKECYCLDLSKNNFANILPKDIDILINCAGIYDYTNTENADINKVSEIIDLNLKAPIYLSRIVLLNMKTKKWGRIINIGSISGSVGEAYATSYSASKAGLIGMTKSMALEYAFDNITVNCINPGWVNSEMTDNNLNEEEKSETLEMIPQKRFIEPKEIADLCLYLASEKAKGMTGQSINLCAGLSLG